MTDLVDTQDMLLTSVGRGSMSNAISLSSHQKIKWRWRIVIGPP